MQWICELQSKEHPEVTVVEVVEGMTNHEAIRNAMFTRNIAASWHVRHLENQYGVVFIRLGVEVTK